MALTDGKTVLLDADLRPHLNSKGIVCQNTNGTWHVLCLNRIEIKKNNETARGMCLLLGFSAYSFHNISTVDEDGRIKRPREVLISSPDDGSTSNLHLLTKRSDDIFDVQKNDKKGLFFSEMVGAPKQCAGLYIQCVPHTIVPIENPIPDPKTDAPTKVPEESTKPTPSIKPTKPIETPEQNTKPSVPIKPTKPSHSVKPIQPIVPVVQPDKTPSVVFPFNQTIHQHEVVDEDTDELFFPWSLNVFVNGNLSCNGILLDKFWALAESDCVNKTEYGKNNILKAFLYIHIL